MIRLEDLCTQYFLLIYLLDMCCSLGTSSIHLSIPRFIRSKRFNISYQSQFHSVFDYFTLLFHSLLYPEKSQQIYVWLKYSLSIYLSIYHPNTFYPSKHIYLSIYLSIRKRKESDNEEKNWIWFGLVWFNGISTFVGYLMPKLLSKNNSSGTI